jgi:hypothetical protein
MRAASGNRLPFRRQNIATEYLNEQKFTLKKGKPLLSCVEISWHALCLISGKFD